MPTHEVNGVELFYDQRGAGAPILFHHGYTGSHDGWAGVVERLQDRYRCIVMDCRGAGESAHPDGGYTIAQYAADVIALADVLALPRFAFVGHSMGGAVGYQLGLEYADRLDRLVLVAPAPADGIQTDPAQRERTRRLRRVRDVASLLVERRAGRAREADEAELVRAVDRALSVSEGHFEESWAALQALRLGGRLAQIETPTLVVAGMADALSAANLADYRRLGNATLHVFTRVGHDVPREVPGGLARVLADFLEHGVVTAATLQARLEDARAAREGIGRT